MIATKTQMEWSKIMPKRRNYAPEFKIKVVMAAFAGQKTVAQLSSEYGVHPTVIHNWIRQAKGAISAEFSGKPRKGKNKEKKQITALQAKVGQLTMERDFLAEAWKKM